MQDSQLGPNGVHYGEVPLYTGQPLTHEPSVSPPGSTLTAGHPSAPSVCDVASPPPGGTGGAESAAAARATAAVGRRWSDGTVRQRGQQPGLQGGTGANSYHGNSLVGLFLPCNSTLPPPSLPLSLFPSPLHCQNPALPFLPVPPLPSPSSSPFFSSGPSSPVWCPFHHKPVRG